MQSERIIEVTCNAGTFDFTALCAAASASGDMIAAIYSRAGEDESRKYPADPADLAQAVYDWALKELPFTGSALSGF